MSVKIMGLVWEADLPHDEKFVLLAYADHADHQGRHIFPSVGLVAWKTGYSPRQIQRITRELQKRGILVPDGMGQKASIGLGLTSRRCHVRRPSCGIPRLSLEHRLQEYPTRKEKNRVTNCQG